MDQSEFTPFELLKQGDPAPLQDMPDANSPLGQAIYERVLEADVASISTERPPKVKHLARVAFAILGIVLLTAAAWLIRSQASETRGIGCYEAATLDSKQIVVAAPGAIEPLSCAELWASSTLVNPQIGEPGIVPPLLGCVNEAGGLAVFPSDNQQLCQTLGLALHETSSDQDPEQTLDRRLLDLFSTQACLPLDNAETLINELLTDQNLNDWKIINMTPSSTARPCASFSLNAANQTITLVPIPDLATSSN